MWACRRAGVRACERAGVDFPSVATNVYMYFIHRDVLLGSLVFSISFFILKIGWFRIHECI